MPRPDALQKANARAIHAVLLPFTAGQFAGCMVQAVGQNKANRTRTGSTVAEVVARSNCAN
jgi:hypothetical protein